MPPAALVKINSLTPARRGIITGLITDQENVPHIRAIVPIEIEQGFHVLNFCKLNIAPNGP